jgi:hypothetical protein
MRQSPLHEALPTTALSPVDPPSLDPLTMPPMPKTRRLPFKPPRQVAAVAEPSASSKKRPSTGSNQARQKKRNVQVSRSPSPEQSPERGSPSPAPSASASASPGPGDNSQSGSSSPEPDFILAEVTREPDEDDILTSEPKVPSKLVTALLQHHFQDSKTRVTKDAAKVYAKYLDIFVREAVARAVYERREAMEDTFGPNPSQLVLESYLEVRSLHHKLFCAVLTLSSSINRSKSWRNWYLSC